MKIKDSEAGFSILELVVYIACLGIIISLAVPKFTTMLATANTGKVQADLQTINAAITMYQLDTGKMPSDVAKDLKEYISHVENIKPPTGDCFIQGKLTKITGEKYLIDTQKEEAVLDEHTMIEFSKNKQAGKN